MYWALGFGLCATLGNSDEGTVVPPVVVSYVTEYGSWFLPGGGPEEESGQELKVRP